MPWLKTISESLRVLPEMSFAHSYNPPDITSMTTRINVRFVPTSLLQLQIIKSYENILNPE
jgi:hypothetical protein